MIEPEAPRRVAITGVGVVGTPFTGGWGALGHALDHPHIGGDPVTPATLSCALDGLDTRRLSRICQLAVAAARLALREAGGDIGARLGVVLGSEWGDLASTREFADGYRARGPAGLSALLFPNTVMNTMAAATSIALQAGGPALTIAAPGIAGELAVARAAAAIAAGRAERLLAGGVDEIDSRVLEILRDRGVLAGARSEGAAFLMLEPLAGARARQARVFGEILGVATGALAARPHGIGRGHRSPVVATALGRAGARAGDIGWVYASGMGDAARDEWERLVLAAALDPHRPPVADLDLAWGHHAGLGALRVAAAARTAGAGLLPALGAAGGPSPRHRSRVPPGPGLVHGLARGGGQAVIVVGPALDG